MTSAAIQDKSLSRRTAEFLDRADPVTSHRSNGTSSAASSDAKFTNPKSVGASNTFVLPATQVTFAEIFSYALPASARVTKFISLIQDIRIARSSNTLAERVDSKVPEAMYLLSDIVSTHFKRVVQESFKVDGFLLEENRESIDRFSHSVKTILAGRQGMKKYKNTSIELAK